VGWVRWHACGRPRPVDLGGRRGRHHPADHPHDSRPRRRRAVAGAARQRHPDATPTRAGAGDGGARGDLWPAGGAHAQPQRVAVGGEAAGAFGIPVRRSETCIGGDRPAECGTDDLVDGGLMGGRVDRAIPLCGARWGRGLSSVR